MRVADLSTVELQRLGSAVLRAYLDAGAGRQPMQSMRPWVTGQPVPDLRGAGAAPHAGLGPVTVLRQGVDQVHVAAVMSEGGGATVVAAELASRDGALRATRVGHVTGTRHDIQASELWVLEPDAPQHLTKLLGPLPTTDQARARWVTAAAVITDYRETWGIEDLTSALGPLPQDPEQRRERDRAVDVARQLVAGIDKEEPGHSPSGREAAGPDLSR